MATLSTIAAVTAITSAIGSTASAIDQQKAGKRAERRQKQANRIQKAKAAAQQSIERRKAIAGARQLQASNIAGAIGQGISVGSSPLQGAQAAIGSGLGSSFAQQGRETTSGQQSFDLRQQAAFTQANAQANANLTQAGVGLLKASNPLIEGGLNAFNKPAPKTATSTPALLLPRSTLT